MWPKEDWLFSHFLTVAADGWDVRVRVSFAGYYLNLIENAVLIARLVSVDQLISGAFHVVMRRTAKRIAERTAERIVALQDMLRHWASRARARVAYRPGGAGYLEARRDFMVRAGQSRGTRSFKPY